MNSLTGHLVLGGIETGNPNAVWTFNVEKVNGVEVTPSPRSSVPKRVRGSKVSEEYMREREERWKMTPAEYEKYREEWERTKSSRVVGGETTLRNGDHLTVYSDESHKEQIWIGAICLVKCEIEYFGNDLPDFYVDKSQIDEDLVYWSNMFIYGHPAKLEPNFGIRQN